MRLQDAAGYTPITQECMNRIKCTRIICGEGSDKYNKYIQELAKKVLQISANRTDEYKNDEVGILARLDGSYESQPIYGYWNEKYRTSIINVRSSVEYDFLTNESSDVSLVIIHNHPCNTTLSLNDILLWLGEDTILAIVAVCHDGKIHYACKKYSNTDKYLKLALKLTNIINKGRISDDEIYSRIVHRQAEFGIVIQ